MCIKNGRERSELSLKRSAVWYMQHTSEGTFVSCAGTDSFVDRTVFVDGSQKGGRQPRTTTISFFLVKP
jgi:hypothetical protein